MTKIRYSQIIGEFYSWLNGIEREPMPDEFSKMVLLARELVEIKFPSEENYLEIQAKRILLYTVGWEKRCVTNNSTQIDPNIMGEYAQLWGIVEPLQIEIQADKSGRGFSPPSI